VKLLLDQGVPRRAAELLREAGVETRHAGEIGLSAAADADILAWCRANGAVAVTLDADLHALIALAGAPAPSTIRIRIQGLKGPETAELIRNVIEARQTDLTAGALVTVEQERTRVRRLPIGRRPR
jgi:predicted nuclease of predicted toxin-antitoxin system